MIPSNGTRPPVKPVPNAPLDIGMPWHIVSGGAGGRGLSAPGSASSSSSDCAFFAVIDANAGKAGLGGFSSASVTTHHNMLAAALRRPEGVDIGEVKRHLLVLWTANQACHRERLPEQLHLYVGLDRVKDRDHEGAAKHLRHLCQVAQALQGTLNDGACERMLQWITDAWKVHANLHDSAHSSALTRVSHKAPKVQPPNALREHRIAVRHDVGLPWKSVDVDADKGVLGGASGTPEPSGRPLFFAVLQDGAVEQGLGGISSASAATHRNRLAMALKKSGGPDLEQVVEHLLALSAENKASCGEEHPTRLHLYMGPGRVKNRGVESAALYLRDLGNAAHAAVAALNDRECRQMLKWMANAWRDHARMLENDEPSVAQTVQSHAEGYAFTRLVAATTRTTMTTAANPGITHSTSTNTATTTATTTTARRDPAAEAMKSLAGRRRRVDEDLERFPDMKDAFHPAARDLCTALAAIPNAELKAHAEAIQKKIKALPEKALARELAIQPFASTRTLRRACALLEQGIDHETLKKFSAAVDAAHRMQMASSDALRDLLIQKSIGKAQVKHLAMLTYARAMTVSKADNIGSQVTWDEVKTMHKHIDKVIRHLASGTHPDSFELQPLLHVKARLQKTLDKLA